ncbi:MAG: DegV family protein [Clostridiales bacterium]|jgi:DegV family protein with EDD domain|nr:DegV family protein [Clostridiales bacterium]
MYKVVGDSSTEVDQSFLDLYPTTIVPFKLYLDGVEYVDDSNLDVDQFVETMKKSQDLPKSACPSPNDFLEQFEGEEEEIYIVTISSKLSGTYNSAMVAKQLYESENPGKKFIHIFDSLGAAAGETLVTRMIHEFKKQNLVKDELVSEVSRFISDMSVMFISESLDNLIKNGRISKWKGLIASTLNILPIMGADENGEIKLVEKVRNSNKAYVRLIEIMQDEIVKNGKKIVAITHVGNWERANQIKEEISKISHVDEIINLKCAGLSSLYADKKGIIVAF